MVHQYLACTYVRPTPVSQPTERQTAVFLACIQRERVLARKLFASAACFTMSEGLAGAQSRVRLKKRAGHLQSGPRKLSS
jgi:hypothetical protein